MGIRVFHQFIYVRVAHFARAGRGEVGDPETIGGVGFLLGLTRTITIYKTSAWLQYYYEKRILLESSQIYY